MTHRLMNTMRLGLLCALLVAGCQSTPDKPAAPLPAPVLPPPPPPSPAEPEPVLSSLNDIILALQDGEQAIAERSLQAMLEQGQNRSVANKLLQQIQTSPEQLLGSEHKTITVMAGDTLSMLAQQHLGDPLLFYALARYNNIAVPRLLERGQNLNIPLARGLANSTAGKQDKRSEKERLATFLLASGERRQGWQTLLQAAAENELSAAGLDQLFSLSQELADASLQEQRGDEAISILNSASAAFSDAARSQQLAQRLLRTRAEIKLQQSDAAAANDDLASAWQLATEAVAIDPEFASASEQASSLQAAVVEQLHASALRYWRDRELAAAIDLWEQLLTVQPDFEPATVYLQRARAMTAKLQPVETDSD